MKELIAKYPDLKAKGTVTIRPLTLEDLDPRMRNDPRFKAPIDTYVMEFLQFNRDTGEALPVRKELVSVAMLDRTINDLKSAIETLEVIKTDVQEVHLQTVAKKAEEASKVLAFEKEKAKK